MSKTYGKCVLPRAVRGRCPGDSLTGRVIGGEPFAAATRRAIDEEAAASMRGQTGGIVC
jgi:hypothetical protein